MLTVPKIVELAEQPYLAIAVAVTIPFEKTIDRVVPELFGWLGQRGVEPAGPLFFKYDLIAMPKLEIQFGVPTSGRIVGDGRIVAGVLPAGRYVELTYFGRYDNLMDVTAMLVGWAKEKGIRWDATEGADGDRFASRLEIYPTDPASEPDPEKWETILRFKVKD
jgi:effector-binding domain-containing protein